VTSTVIGVLAVVLVVLAALALMRLGWVRRGSRSALVVPELPAVPADRGAVVLGPVEATYLSTTVAGRWLERVTTHGLGVRAPASVTVSAAGVTVTRNGAPDLFLPTTTIVGVARTGGIAGTAVGGGRLVMLTWRLGPALLDTGLLPRRAADRVALVDAVRALTRAGTKEDRG
jgi:hypothetical protein